MDCVNVVLCLLAIIVAVLGMFFLIIGRLNRIEKLINTAFPEKPKDKKGNGDEAS